MADADGFRRRWANGRWADGRVADADGRCRWIEILIKQPNHDLTSPVLLCTIPAGAFFRRKWPPLDLTSPVAANRLATGAFFR